jgi:hypothetical protein
LFDTSAIVTAAIDQMTHARGARAGASRSLTTIIDAASGAP